MQEETLHNRHFQVYVEQRPGHDRPVLVKEPASELSNGSHLGQLHNEFSITCQLADVAGVRPALAKEGTASQPQLLLEYIEGQSLAELISSASLDLAEKLQLAVNVSIVLDRIHERQLMHKDVSSGNILVASGDAPGSQNGTYVIDFGTASAMPEQGAGELATDDSLLGTLAYISPEQTGRINRVIDYRTDLYSLGVVLYELLAGQLPFDSNDPLELIHDHIARSPPPPQEIEPTIPGPVSDIVLRLLAKNAEDRYQTIRGLLVDLENCLDQWRRKGRIEPFRLGRDDLSGRLRIPQKLYGRQAELERLRSILDGAFTAQPQLLLVAGYSGVGKTSLIRELKRDIAEKRGTYLEGKFDQLQRNRPYSAWQQAFTKLVDNWLAQSEASLSRRRGVILEALGDQGQVLIDIIPALEQVLGPQPEVPELGGVGNQNRIHYLFNLFIACLATPEDPLVVFLDDLQWIDPASLNFVEALLASQSAGRLLVIGAYRSNEVDANHPLTISKNRMQAESNRITVIELGDLPAEDTHHLLADSLHMGVADCGDLGQVLVERSAGNPFFFRQLLYGLEADGLLSFDRGRRRWMWDDILGQSLPACGSIVDFLIGKIRALPDATQRALSMAACVGGRFDMSTLHTILGKPEPDIIKALAPALRAGLILRSKGHFSFTHDRIQEAGYALIPDSDRPALHLALGRSLLVSAGSGDPEGEIFAIVSHMNVGRASIDSDSERIELAGLNLAAGKRAKAASAHADAKTYVEIGLELLGTHPWKDQYDLALSLHNENAELASLVGQFDEVTTTATLIHANARHNLDRARIYMTQIEAATAQSRHAEGLNLGLAALRELGVDIPEQPTPEDGRQLHETFIGLLTTEPMERLDQLPQMSDARALAASSLLASVMSTAYQYNPALFPIISYRGAILTFEFGIDIWSPFFVGGVALANVASITPDVSDDDARRLIPFIRQLVDMTKVLLDNPITAMSRSKGLLMLSFTTPWFETIEDSIEVSRATYDSGNETGDWLYSSYGAVLFAIFGFTAGVELSDYRRQLSAYTTSFQAAGQVNTPNMIAVYLQAADNFIESSPEPHRLNGAYFDEDACLSQVSTAANINTRHFLSVGKLALAYHFDRDDSLDDYSVEAERLLDGGPCLLSSAQFYLYQALAKLRMLGYGDATNHADILNLVGKNLRWMRVWSESSPSTFQHWYDLIAAERARVTDDLEGALDHYERAISGAQASGFTHDEALANELYARFWLERGGERFGSLFMREAQSLYRKWGALAKADHLAERYPKSLVQRRALTPDADASSISVDLTAVNLDLRTILKASEDIASEIQLDSLLSKLMAHVIENTGAQTGCLVREGDGHWLIEVRASVDEQESYARIAEDIEGSSLLAEGIVRYVARKGETVVLDDASRSGMFVDLRYVQAHQVKSVLCTPLISDGKIVAILYLENNLAPNVFSPDRVSLLTMLSSQMAISIDNARTHAELEQLLETRSRALASAEAQVRTLFEDSPLGIALANAEGGILSVNKAVEEMLRISKKEILEHSVFDFYDDPSARDALLRRVKESGYIQEFGVQLIRFDGSRFHGNLNVSTLTLEGNEVLLAMIQDVTAQITAEQEAAALEERARLARELHDAVSQTILSASLLADGTVRAAEKGRAVQTQGLAKLSGMLHGALDEMRTLLLEMRPAAMRDRTLGQLLAPIVEAARTRSGAGVKLRVTGDHTLPQHVTGQLQRIAQESVNNAIRHAEAEIIRVDLDCDPEGISLRITDDGRGFDAGSLSAGHHGLSIMRERAEDIGAVFEVCSAIGKGTEVSVSWS